MTNQPFSTWFKQQATRQDAIGKLARRYPNTKSLDKLTDQIEKPLQYPVEHMMLEDLKTAYAAMEEYDKGRD